MIDHFNATTGDATPFAESQWLIMGVSGSGKSTIGAALATALGCRFIEADDFHPAANIEKMRRGEALTDEDRRPWLAALCAQLTEQGQQSWVLACSALRHQARAQLLAAAPFMRIAHLHGSRELIAQRLVTRQHAYMPASLLDSQFSALELPHAAFLLDISQPVAQLVQDLLQLSTTPISHHLVHSTTNV